MSPTDLLVANRGEVAIRVMRAAAELGDAFDIPILFLCDCPGTMVGPEIEKRACEAGKAVNVASHFEFDDVIDPMESRRWISGALGSVPAPAARTGKKRPHVDAW